MSTGAKVALWIAGIVIGLLAVVVIGFGLYVRIAFGSFYAQAQDEFTIPGIGEGFVCQDLDYYDPAGAWLFSGYSTKGDAAPVYRLDSKGDTAELFVKLPDGSTYTDHGSGITTTDAFAFLACEQGYLVFNAADFMNARNGEYVTAIDKVDLEITPAFMNIENDTLYLGTFHRIPNYPAPQEHHRMTSDGTENAGILLAYPPSEVGRYGFAAQAQLAYSIPDLVQGVCVLPNGDIVLSKSWGLQESHLSTYNTRLGAVVEEIGIDGRAIPLFILNSDCLVADLAIPPMSEGIEYHNGRIYISEEAASDKYVFGKLYGAGQVYSIAASE